MVGVTTWKTIDVSAQSTTGGVPAGDGQLTAVSETGVDVRNTWTIAGSAIDPDGLYELRAIVSCHHNTQSSTKVVQGRIDQTQPHIVSLETSSKSNTFVVTDVITVTYSEPILCSGINQVSTSPIVPTIAVTIRDDTFSTGGYPSRVPIWYPKNRDLVPQNFFYKCHHAHPRGPKH